LKIIIGTGHGVGYFLNVHEPGVGITRYGTSSLEAGMFFLKKIF